MKVFYHIKGGCIDLQYQLKGIDRLFGAVTVIMVLINPLASFLYLVVDALSHSHTLLHLSGLYYSQEVNSNYSLSHHYS